MKNYPVIPYPDPAILNEFQKEYISLINPTLSLIEALDFSYQQLMETIQNISEVKSTFKYQPDKWSIKTLIMHISDTERVFQYRAISIARGSKANLMSFDENEFAANSNAEMISFQKIQEEYSAVAHAFKLIFENLKGDSYNKKGMVSNIQISPVVIGFMAAGHRLHHLNILKERYLR